jgi:DNA repair protein RadC
MDTKDLKSGHRKRLKEKFLKVPIRSLADYEILEMVLFEVFTRCDTRDMAKLLINKFGSVAGVLNAEPIELKKIEGIGDNAVFHLKLLLDLFSRLHVSTKSEQPILSNWHSVINYCNLTMGFRKTECFRVLYLNKKNTLIADELSEGGTIDKVQIYPREIAKKAIEHSAAAVILVHNHPSGEAKPSAEDIEMTKEINAALSSLSIKIHDHLIVANNNHFSFRASGLI